MNSPGKVSPLPYIEIMNVTLVSSTSLEEVASINDGTSMKPGKKPNSTTTWIGGCAIKSDGSRSRSGYNRMRSG